MIIRVLRMHSYSKTGYAAGVVLLDATSTYHFRSERGAGGWRSVTLHQKTCFVPTVRKPYSESFVTDTYSQRESGKFNPHQRTILGCLTINVIRSRNDLIFRMSKRNGTGQPDKFNDA